MGARNCAQLCFWNVIELDFVIIGVALIEALVLLSSSVRGCRNTTCWTAPCGFYGVADAWLKLIHIAGQRA